MITVIFLWISSDEKSGDVDAAVGPGHHLWNGAVSVDQHHELPLGRVELNLDGLAGARVVIRQLALQKNFRRRQNAETRLNVAYKSDLHKRIVAKALDGQRYPLPLCECKWV